MVLDTGVASDKPGLGKAGQGRAGQKAPLALLLVAVAWFGLAAAGFGSRRVVQANGCTAGKIAARDRASRRRTCCVPPAVRAEQSSSACLARPGRRQAVADRDYLRTLYLSVHTYIHPHTHIGIEWFFTCLAQRATRGGPSDRAARRAKKNTGEVWSAVLAYAVTRLAFVVSLYLAT
ncbi:uncharacterized protein K452DRAFT_121750 [Aplosporella prunicola CBS 121167]|uniref:Uncharacterized protein n=1 Tax=Aplosporella prunicola CBS 121167 TaxID=1176127 RepID=A0A6A6BQG4_9PEZI|nr:uncharacterized protein K452DRAFT_121750 [Aplosporella prunicola CBS 121167]KAF2145545.1 hypothetical protein K452DRAFT_121750 [Aplosporella prunicola CBS 121167]